MSMATECDLCGALFKPAQGSVVLGEFCVMRSDCETLDTWSDVDLCQMCSAPILKILGKALNGLDETLAAANSADISKGTS